MMLLKIKTMAWQLVLIIPFLLLTNEVKAQGQVLNDAYANARYYYSNGQYQNVYNTLKPHVNAMNNTARHSYYKENEDGIGMVFRVYKMIIESEYAMNQIENAEWFENYVINYFRGIFSPDDVLDYLDYAQL
jgi:hypothetical protein